jgi:lysozyme
LTTSLNGIAMIELAEGFRAQLYEDNGHPCIGYGCDLSLTEAASYEGRTIDQAEAEALLKTRLVPVEQAINNLVHQQLSQNQFDALADFIYNVGTGAFRTSTLLRRLNHGNFQGAADQFLRWNKVAGVPNDGLKARRAKERSLFLAPDPPPLPEETEA